MNNFLQLIKETGVRCREAYQLLWTDIYSKDYSIIVTPEKGSNTRKLNDQKTCGNAKRITEEFKKRL